MKQDELRRFAVCSLCGQRIGHTGLPLFWRVTVERFGVDLQAIRRQDDLAALIGNTAIAAVMGPNEDLAQPLAGPVVLSVCEACCTAQTCVAELAEKESRA